MKVPGGVDGLTELLISKGFTRADEARPPPPPPVSEQTPSPTPTPTLTPRERQLHKSGLEMMKRGIHQSVDEARTSMQRRSRRTGSVLNQMTKMKMTSNQYVFPTYHYSTPLDAGIPKILLGIGRECSLQMKRKMQSSRGFVSLDWGSGERFKGTTMFCHGEPTSKSR